jgi:3-oxoacyl-[acyl-carrier-protein] synthase-3
MGLPPVPCFDLRQQCTGFLYALQLADAHVRSGLARTVLVVAAETHHGFMPWTPENFRFMIGESEIPPTPEEYARNTELRHMVVLFGDAGAAVVIRASRDGDRGVIDQQLYGNGAEYRRLFVPGNGFARQPYVDADQVARGEHRPIMDGRQVFRLATSHMVDVAREVLSRNGLTPADVKLVLMHQANLRINEYCQKALELPAEKVPHNIHECGNTTAATIPLLWDECRRDGRLEAGDLVLLVAFGAGMTWGATLLRA